MVLSKLRQAERLNEKDRDKIRTEMRKLQEEVSKKRSEYNQLLSQIRKHKGMMRFFPFLIFKIIKFRR